MKDVSKEVFYSAILDLKNIHGLTYKFNPVFEKNKDCISAYFKFLDSKGVPKASGILKKYKINGVDVFVYAIPNALSHDIVVVTILKDTYEKLGFKEVPWVPLGHPNPVEDELIERLKNG